MCVEKVKLGLVVSEYNYDITMAMEERAKAHAKVLGAEVVRVLRVPGVFEIPLGVKKMLESGDVDGVVAIGAVIQGETKHDEVVMHNAARKIEDLMVEYGVPVGLGISGHGQSRLHAEARIEKAKDAVESVVKMVRRLRGEDV